MPVIFCHNLAVKEFPLLWTKQQFQDICSWRERERERDWKRETYCQQILMPGPFHWQRHWTRGMHRCLPWVQRPVAFVILKLHNFHLQYNLPKKICNPDIRDIWDSAVCHVDSTQIGNAVIALIHHPSWSKTEEASQNLKHKNDKSVRNRNCRHSFEPSTVIKNHLIHTWRRTGQFIAFLHSSRCEYSYPGGVMIPHLPQSQIQSTKLSQIIHTYIHTYIHSRQSKPSPNLLRQLLEDNKLAAKTVEGSKPKESNST